MKSTDRTDVTRQTPSSISSNNWCTLSSRPSSSPLLDNIVRYFFVVGFLSACVIDACGSSDRDEVEIEGYVTRFRSIEDFHVGGQPVTTNAQTRFENGNAGDLAVGVRVEVEGFLNAEGLLVAREIEFDDDRDDYDDDRDEVEIEGYVTRFRSIEDFHVGGQPVTTNAQTRFENGNAGDLAVGVRVEVEGFLNAEGLLVAREVEFDDDFDGVFLGENFFFSAWYGTYNVTYYPWVFHTEHGWQYVFETANQGKAWLFDHESQDYWWTRSNFQPLTVWSNSRQTYNFYFVGTTNPRRFIDLETEEFWTIP